MAAHDNLGAQFMTAREIVDTHHPNEYERQKVGKRWETDEEVLGRKLAESKLPESGRHGEYGSLFDAVAAEGVTGTIHLAQQPAGPQGRPQIVEGNHRVAIMNVIDPDRPLRVMRHANTTEAHDYAEEHG